jgi:hypothetical protein
MNSIYADINNFITSLKNSGLGGILVLALIVGALYWLYNAGKSVYKEMRLKYNPVFAVSLAIMAAFVDLIQPNTYRSRTAQDIIIQFGTVVVAIIFALIIIVLVLSNWDVVSNILRG